MKQRILDILSGLPVKDVKQVGTLWSISLYGVSGSREGSMSGAREDGTSLARDLKDRWRKKEAERIRAKRAEAPVKRVVYQENPETLRKLAEMEAMLAAAAAPKPEGAFDASQLSDLIREDEPHADAQRRWLSDFTQLTNRLVDIRLPALNDAERAYQRRLQAALYSSRRGAVETI